MNQISTYRPLLILDLDECLIFGTNKELGSPADFRVGPFHIYRRPGLSEFLTAAAEWYDLAIWSSASTDYVEGIADSIRPASLNWEFAWGRDRCTQRTDFERMETVYIKDLKKVKRLGYALERVLFVDDTPSKMARNYGNAIYIQAFEGQAEDDELIRLARYLEAIHNEANFRDLEKRGWRSRFS